ncbi:major facilitator superfamily domain-containing protein [Ditylenchus destructor]|uniref:Major facilitator superfamily domain-containing protein n=1 Tax=Ditylenchus destructor TaxID=166010 RepID=A0AAD4N577_9BILA|nr:major facilitator superfamily domain-containing protein [Ditylenchus destructor]
MTKIFIENTPGIMPHLKSHNRGDWRNDSGDSLVSPPNYSGADNLAQAHSDEEQIDSTRDACDCESYSFSPLNDDASSSEAIQRPGISSLIKYNMLPSITYKDKHRGDRHPRHSPWLNCRRRSGDCDSLSGKLFHSASTSSSSSLEEGYLKSLTTDRPSLEVGEQCNSVSSVLFPSMRLLLAVLLCCCYITISISSSNIAVALICMIRCPVHGYIGELEWQSDQEGLVLAAQNAGSLIILVTGFYADRINGKWMVGASLILCLLGNFALPLFAADSFWYAVLGRLAIGASDALASPAVNSLITRWFPHNERAVAVGIITGGRQIGTLFILPTAGYLCTRTDLQGGWPAIFYLSALIAGLVVTFWIPMGADKPSKQHCISNRERLFIESRIACESIGKRTHARKVPWSDLLSSVPLWVAIFSLICHEYPLVIMLQFIPNYMRDVLEFSPTKNGILSALPILFLLISKTASSYLSTWMTANTRWNSTTICKTFNAIASLGLSLSILAVSQCDKEHAHYAISALCLAMAFAGLHSPGVSTALLQLAPAHSGIITGIAYFSVAWFSIGNKILTKWIVQNGLQEEWAKVFYISAFIAALPVPIFTLWGDNKRQFWAGISAKSSMCSTASFCVNSLKQNHNVKPTKSTFYTK